MLTSTQRDTILFQTQTWIASTGYELVEQEEYAISSDNTYKKAFRALAFMLCLQDADVDLTLTDKQQDFIYKSLQDCLNLGNYSVANIPYVFSDNVTFTAGAQGLPGTPGTNGNDGSNANIIVQGDSDGDITVSSSTIGLVTTYTLKYTPYVYPNITFTADPALSSYTPDQAYVVQLGRVITSLNVYVNLFKGRNNVTASTFTNPTGLDSSYQSLLNFTTINTIGTQTVDVIASNVNITTNYTANITDGINTINGSFPLTFVYPFLYGNTASNSTTGLYSNLNKLTRTQANQVVNFNGTVRFFWFGFPVEYGSVLTSIRDENGFDVTGSFTNTGIISVTSTGLDVNWTHNYYFYYTTAATTITSSSYTFNF